MGGKAPPPSEQCRGMNLVVLPWRLLEERQIKQKQRDAAVAVAVAVIMAVIMAVVAAARSHPGLPGGPGSPAAPAGPGSSSSLSSSVASSSFFSVMASTFDFSAPSMWSLWASCRCTCLKSPNAALRDESAAEFSLSARLSIEGQTQSSRFG